eukprot:10083025-Lingulodinium_polyedra.AAC.1
MEDCPVLHRGSEGIQDLLMDCTDLQLEDNATVGGLHFSAGRHESSSDHCVQCLGCTGEEGVEGLASEVGALELGDALIDLGAADVVLHDRVEVPEHLHAQLAASADLCELCCDSPWVGHELEDLRNLDGVEDQGGDVGVEGPEYLATIGLQLELLEGASEGLVPEGPASLEVGIEQCVQLVLRCVPEHVHDDFSLWPRSRRSHEVCRSQDPAILPLIRCTLSGKPCIE